MARTKNSKRRTHDRWATLQWLGLALILTIGVVALFVYLTVDGQGIAS